VPVLGGQTKGVVNKQGLVVPYARWVGLGEDDTGKQAKALLMAQRPSNALRGMFLLGRARYLTGRLYSKRLVPKGVCGQGA